MQNTGVFTAIALYLERRRIGDLLLAKGLVTEGDLQSALTLQKQTQTPLGQIFIEFGLISHTQLCAVLCKQAVLRSCAVLVMGVCMFMGLSTKKSWAEAQSSQNSGMVLASISPEFSKMAAYPNLLGMGEKRSSNLKPFTKWTTVIGRFESHMRANPDIVKKIENRLENYRGQSLKEMADSVNDMMNERPYISDARNWGQNDYWATPVEFMKRGGDCEDFALAKYAALRTLGVPEERLRLAIVQDTQKNIPHAVLVVYTDEGAYLLDNQIKTLVNAERSGRYVPIYSINRHAWWLHSTPDGTRVASR